MNYSLDNFFLQNDEHCILPDIVCKVENFTVAD